jgi:very-short-patch-repair endonuclease
VKHNPLIVAAFFQSNGVPAPATEVKFHPTRKWRFDYAWHDSKVALEIEGGVWIGGRHTSGAGFVKDMEKYNEASALGWRIIRFQPKELLKSSTVEILKRCLGI